MGYMHIENLYKSQAILLFKECYALEKIHGTSAHISYRAVDGAPVLHFSPGEVSSERFRNLFPSHDLMLRLFEDVGQTNVTVYGEAYGGKIMGASETYGKELRFIAFDVMIDGLWLSVPNAHDVVTRLGLEFVDYVKTSTDLAALDALRDAPSMQAALNGGTQPHPREGVVLRPVIEVRLNDGNRIIAKHKGEAFGETAKARKVVDPALLEVLTAADAIADEWVTPMRLAHVLGRLNAGRLNAAGAEVAPLGMGDTLVVITAMTEDVEREAKGEIVMSKEAAKAIGRKTAVLFKRHLNATVSETPVSEAPVSETT